MEGSEGWWLSAGVIFEQRWQQSSRVFGPSVHVEIGSMEAAIPKVGASIGSNTSAVQRLIDLV
jgi:hypothetical protein